MKTSTQRWLSLGLAALLGGAAAGAAAQSGPIKVPLSNPARPVTLEVRFGSGDLRVEAYDGKEVLVSSDDADDDGGARARFPGSDDQPRERDGLHRLRNTSAGFTVEEADNVVTVQTDFAHGNDNDLMIQVPRNTSVHAKSFMNGDMTVVGVTGEHELSNVNGDVTATDIGGTIVVNANNGDIDVSLKDISAGKALSFTSFNGDIDVTLPANVKADLVVSGAQGDIWTDFDVTVQPREPTVEREGGNGNRYRVRMQQDMHGTINGGGPELRFKTFHGDITIRKRK
jgi:hypothetical protein